MADQHKISGDAKFPNKKLVERFLAELETELRHDANKSLLPYFADLRDDHSRIEQKLDILTEQIEADRKAREARATQIDDSGEKVTAAGQLIYDSKQKIEPQPPLPVIHCALEAIDEDNDRYRSVITNDKGRELHKHNFTLKRDDVFLLNANHWLENDGLKDYQTHFELDSDRTFTQRLGQHYFELIFGDQDGEGGLHLGGGDHLFDDGAFNCCWSSIPKLNCCGRCPGNFCTIAKRFWDYRAKCIWCERPKVQAWYQLNLFPSR